VPVKKHALFIDKRKDNEMLETIIKSPLKAIRLNCLECVGSANEVKLCTSKRCSLYEFRFGKNPYLKKVLTKEQKEELNKRLKRGREKKKNT